MSSNKVYAHASCRLASLLSDGDLCPLVWDLLDLESRNCLMRSSKALARSIAPRITSVVLNIPEDAAHAREAASGPRVITSWLSPGLALCLQGSLVDCPGGHLSSYAFQMFLSSFMEHGGRDILALTREVTIQYVEVDAAIGCGLVALILGTPACSMKLSNDVVDAQAFSNAWVLPQLSCLSATGCTTQMSDSISLSPFTSFSMLTTLEVDCCDARMEAQDMKPFTRYWRHLKCLKLSQTELCNGAMEVVLEGWPDVEELEVAGVETEKDLRRWPCKWKKLSIEAIDAEHLIRLPRPEGLTLNCDHLELTRLTTKLDLEEAVDFFRHCRPLRTNKSFGIYVDMEFHTANLSSPGRKSAYLNNLWRLSSFRSDTHINLMKEL